MRNDFCVFILTHGRPDRVKTWAALDKAGYTGRRYIVIDDEDATEQEYRDRYGDHVIQFSKEAIAPTFDEGDNFSDRRTITYARNATWDLAKQVGVKYWMHLDDDYSNFGYKLATSGNYINHADIKNLDNVVTAMIRFMESTPTFAVAMAQGGDFIGGKESSTVVSTKSRMRKCMNTFLCATDKPFKFSARFNEDVNTYTPVGNRGGLFLTIYDCYVIQTDSQSQPGGITELYKNYGTYVKAFTSVMYAPSAVKVRMMTSRHARLHHQITWNNAVPKIIREAHQKPRLLT